MARRVCARLTVGELRKAIEHVQDHHQFVVDFHTEYDGEDCTKTGAVESVMVMDGIGEVLLTATEEYRP